MSFRIKPILLLLAILFISSIDLFAAGPPGPPGGGGGGPPGGCWPPSACIPLDGGIGFLLLAGAAYGGKKVYDMSKDKKKAE
ncbi:MAG: hypothetical protein P1U41_08385 [Vicingaceae bacterium]|nr:hypothetical protein [Vicingaceae bacterium]